MEGEGAKDTVDKKEPPSPLQRNGELQTGILVLYPTPQGGVQRQGHCPRL